MMAGCPSHASPAGWRTHTRFPASNPTRTYRESSVIRRRGSLLWFGGQKNNLRHVWHGALDLVRPPTTTRPGPAVWGLSNLSEPGGAAGLVAPVWGRGGGGNGGFSWGRAGHRRPSA